MKKNINKKIGKKYKNGIKNSIILVWRFNEQEIRDEEDTMEINGFNKYFNNYLYYIM